MAASEQTKKHFLTLDQKRDKKIKRSIANNSNGNAEAISLRLFCKKDVLKSFIMFMGKHPVPESLF